ncbi:MAG: archease [Nitrospirota bacterium]
MAKQYRIFGTTADVGAESFGSTLAEAFEAQAEGMFSVMAELDAVRASEAFTVEAEGADDETLLVAFLNELLFLFDARGVLFREFKVIKIGGGKLKAVARGEKIDRLRHVIMTPVKAVTYHMLKVEKTTEGYKTRVVYDI